MPRITVSLPCYERPYGTKKSIEAIRNQTINNWEAFIMGDACPDFQKLIDSGYLEDVKNEEEKRGNIVHYFNSENRCAVYGYKLTNYAIQNATGNYFVFYANDDLILPNHFEHYLSEIENTEYDAIYYNSFSVDLQAVRDTKFVLSCIGHCDIIVKTDTAKLVAEHEPNGYHDWTFIANISKLGKVKKAESNDYTYIIF
jgi:glycosyltransferase involved in cell wall biosynthesis